MIDKNLAIYLGTVRYIDKEQADDILNVSMEISDSCRNILNNVKRIGINYNQELRLKTQRRNIGRLWKKKVVTYIVK